MEEQALTARASSSSVASGPVLRVAPWLFVSLAGAWGLFVVGSHVVALPVDWSGALTDAATVLAATRDLTLDVVQGHLVVFASLLVILGAATTLGCGLLTRVRREALSTGERLLFGAVLGLGVLTLLVLALMALGWVSRVGAWVSLGALTVLGALGAVRRRLDARGGDPARAGLDARPPPRPARRSLLDRLALGALALHAGITLVSALAPLTFYDSLAYHVSAPQLSLHDGRLVPMPDNLLAQMPAAGGSLFALALSLQSELAGKALGWCLGVLVVAAIVLFARRMRWTGAGLWGALVFATMFPVSQVFTIGGIDPLLTLFAVCSTYAFLLWMQTDRRDEPGGGAFPLLVLSAVFSGFGMGTKYTGVLVPAALVGCLFVSTCRSRADAVRCLRASLWMGLISGLVLAPWLIRNLALYGNPVTPFLPGIFTPDDAEQIRALQSFAAEAGQRRPDSLWDYLSLPWRITVGAVPNSVGFSPLFLALAPLLLLFRNYPRILRWVALFAACFALGWLRTSTVVRYLMPALPWACLLLAYWMLHAHMPRALRVAIKASVLACCLTGLVGFGTVVTAQGGWKVVLGSQTREDYLSHAQGGYTNPPFALYRWIDEHLPQTARVLLLGETRGVYLDRSFVAGSVFKRNPLVCWAERSDGPDQLAALLAEQGLTHLIINPMEALRLQPYGTLRTTPAARQTIQLFWRRHVREVVNVTVPSSDPSGQRLALYALSTEGHGELLQSDPIGRLLQTP